MLEGMPSRPAARSAALALACAAALLGLTACSEDTGGEPSVSPPPLAAEGQTAGPTADGATTDATAGAATGATTSATSGSTPRAALVVEPEGEGPFLLRLATGRDEVDALGSAEEVSGTLVSGPGGCLAVQPQSEAELLVIGPDAVLGTAPPTLTLQGSEAGLGEPVEIQATPVHLEDLDGVPEPCLDGVADTAWVVAGG